MSSPAPKVAGKVKNKHLRPKHQKVKFHANEPVLSVFMWGINHTISQLRHISIPIMLMPDDFKANTKIKVDNYMFNKENMPGHFKVKEYCPLVFRNLRERFSITDYDYLQSLTRSEPEPVIHAGKSSASFYESSDRLYIIKSLSREEVELMHHFLKQYHPYIVERHGQTLLPQYLGTYRVTLDGVDNYLVVIRNVFSSRLPLHKKFDLKGSKVDRDASSKELLKELPTLKDNDLIKDGVRVSIGEVARERFFETLAADVQFLIRLQLMDYSLLLGVHDVRQFERERHLVTAAAAADSADEEVSCGGAGGYCAADTDSADSSQPDQPPAPTPPASPPARSHNHALLATDIYAIPSCYDTASPDHHHHLEAAAARGEEGDHIYFMGLIDVLTHYGMKKQAARAAKTVKYGSGAVDGISTVEPEVYGKRFLQFMRQVIT